jgi:hypothetical protein
MLETVKPGDKVDRNDTIMVSLIAYTSLIIHLVFSGLEKLVC